MTPLSACPACGAPIDRTSEVRRSGPLRAAGTTLDVRLARCACGHVFVEPQPTWDELAPFYQSDYHVFADVLPDAQYVDRLIATRHRGDRLNHALVVPGGRYLDVGCGLGGMVAGMARLGMDAEGVEPASAAVERARSLGLKIFHGMLADARYPDASFDSVSMYHVLEHAPDPVELLAECRRILKPAGELLIGVPNIDSLVQELVGPSWSAFDLPRHLHHFTAASLAHAARRAGLAAVEIESESLPEHVEGELAGWLRRRWKVPARLTLKTHLTLPIARRLARRGNASGRGEALVARFRPLPTGVAV